MELGVLQPKIGRYSLTLAAYSINPVVTRVLGQAVSLEAGAFMTTIPTGVELHSEVNRICRRPTHT